MRQLPKSRNKVYQLEEDEKDLLDDSWEENISDEEMIDTNPNMERNKVKFYQDLKDHRESELENKKENYD